MTYEAFKTEYAALVARLLAYSPKQAGAKVYAEKLADLVDAHPEFESRYDAEDAA